MSDDDAGSGAGRATDADDAGRAADDEGTGPQPAEAGGAHDDAATPGTDTEEEGGRRLGRTVAIVGAFLFGTVGVFLSLLPFSTTTASGAPQSCGPPVFEVFAGGQRELRANIAETCRDPATARLFVAGFFLFVTFACALVLTVRDREERQARQADWLRGP